MKPYKRDTGKYKEIAGVRWQKSKRGFYSGCLLLLGFFVAFSAMTAVAEASFMKTRSLPFSQSAENRGHLKETGKSKADGLVKKNPNADAKGGTVAKKDSLKEEKPVQDQEFLVLINKEHPIGEDEKPEDLTPIKYYAKDREEVCRYMRKEVAQQFHLLVETAAKEKGYEFVMTTAYRSYGYQSVLYNNYVKREGEASANTYSAKPGQSEHQSGLATDVSSPVVDYRLTVDFGATPEGEWLAENAHRFGFIIRFPLGKEAVTGYQYEPWHIRYVGQPAADEIYASDLTLEEYLIKLEKETE